MSPVHQQVEQDLVVADHDGGVDRLAACARTSPSVGWGSATVKLGDFEFASIAADRAVKAINDRLLTAAA